MGSVTCDLPLSLLQFIENEGEVNSLEYAKSNAIDHQKIIGAIKSLESLGDVSIIFYCISCVLC